MCGIAGIVGTGPVNQRLYDALTILRSGQVDVVIDATGRPTAGAEIGLATIRSGKHLVMMNVEADVTIGPVLRREADRAGLVYTVGAGVDHLP